LIASTACCFSSTAAHFGGGSGCFELTAAQETVTSGQSNFTQSRIAPCTNCANICSQKMLRLNAVNNKHLCAALTAMPTQRHVTFFVLVL